MSEEGRRVYDIPPLENLLASDSTVNHPKHYNKGKIEVIDFIEDQKLGFHLGNVVKYVSRADLGTEKGIEDLKKALWYLKRYIDKEIYLNHKECK